MGNMYTHHLLSVVGSLRSLAANGIVQSMNDSGAAQVVTLKTHDGATRADVEVAQPFGFSSMAPAYGAVTSVFEIGGDPSNLVALPVSNPYCRFGDLESGETVMYAADGSRVHIRAGGIVDIWGGASVTIHTKACVVNAPNGCTINGDVTVNGSLTATGDVSDSHGSLNRLRGNYNLHTNPDNGAATPSTPDPE